MMSDSHGFRIPHFRYLQLLLRLPDIMPVMLNQWCALQAKQYLKRGNKITILEIGS
jgi:hypothetical protein